MLHITDMTYRIAGRALFDGASCTVPARAKVGLIGPNGAGKTTLFKLITGELSPESGEIRLRKDVRIGQVAQEAPGTDDTLIEFVLKADRERTALMDELETTEDPNRIAEIHMRLVDIDAHSAEARAGSVLNGLGFDAEAQKRACREFSGGWRMRVALAAVLFTEPDLLLLDEPTNYLDLEGALWLESYIARYPHTVIMISHDRDLLNRAVTSILHLDALKLAFYRGGYDQFDRQRRQQQELQQKFIKKQQEQRKHMEAFVERFRYKASKAKQAQSRLKALAKLEPIAALADATMLPIELPQPKSELAPPIVTLEGASVGYAPGKPVLRHLDLRIDPDDRIGLLGQNGNGKSTFAKLLSGRLTVEDGELRRSGKLEIAYFAQHQLDELRPRETAVDHVARLMPGVPEAKVRSRVARMGLMTSRMNTRAEDLSGGEKARLLLGLATFSEPHLLILDEPTNHLDIDAREALVQALNTYEGAVILISHDRHLLEACADRLWLVADGTVTPYADDLDAYRRKIGERGSKKSGDVARKQAEAEAANSQERRRQSADLRARMAPLRKEVKAAEKAIESLNRKLEKLDRTLADGTIFNDRPDEAARLAKERSDTLSEIVAAEERWLELSAELEEGMANAD